MSGKSRKERLQEMLADDPNDPFLHYGLAMESVSEGNDEEAAVRLLELTGRTPDYVPAYQQAGQALLRLGRNDEARAILQAGIRAARAGGQHHPADEMQGMLDGI
jgi:predicted Zn-dependent protease